MNAGWSDVSTVQQNLFLQQTGLSELPGVEALTQAQLSVLTAIVGEDAVAALRETDAADSLAQPALPPPAIKTNDWSSIMMLVAELQAKSTEMQINAASESIQATKESVAKSNEEKLKKIMESIESQSGSNVGATIGKIFGWIGAALGLVGAIAATIITHGAAAPLIALAVVGIGIMVATETGLMEKALNFIIEHPALLFVVMGPLAGGVLFGLLQGGVIEEEHAKMAMQVALTVTMLAMSIAGAVLTFGASSAGVFAEAMKIVGAVGQIAGGVASMGSGAASVAQAAYQYEASMAQADAAEITAWLAKLQSIMSEESELLQQLMSQLNSGMTMASEVLAGMADSNQSVIANMGA